MEIGFDAKINICCINAGKGINSSQSEIRFKLKTKDHRIIYSYTFAYTT